MPSLGKNSPPKSIAISEPGTVIKDTKDKFKRNIFFYSLFLASSKDADEQKRQHLFLPKFSDDFLESYSYVQKTERASFLRAALGTFLNNRRTSTDYLLRGINFLHLNNATSNLLLMSIFHPLPLDEERPMIGQRISILTFLPPPKEVSLSLREYENYVRKTKESEMEFAVGEVAEKIVTIDNNSFVEGRQDSYSDAITTIANLDAFCTFLCEYNTGEEPDFVCMMRDLADFLSQSEFQKFAEKQEHKTPWLTHTLVCALHSILRSFVLVANDFTYQRQVEHLT